MVRTVVASVYIGVWGIATIIILIKNGTVPPEYWTLPAVGLGGLIAALNSLDRKFDKPKVDTPPDDDKTAKENP